MTATRSESMSPVFERRSTTRTLRIGRIPYLNVAPFYFDLRALAPYELLIESPRLLGERARRGELDLAPLSLCDTFDLPEMAPVGDFSVACRGRVGSVMLFSRVPLDELGAVTIRATSDSVTSVRLLEVLLRSRGTLEYRIVREHPSPDALLLIGDEALSEARAGRWPVATDLCEEWTERERLPFVFARWYARQDAEQPALLEAVLARSLAAGLADIPAVIGGIRSPLEPAEARAYLEAFSFRPGQDGERAVARFRELMRVHELL